ncbi:MAG TPA: L-histidine N(alpha)-methyltransferase [Terriglobia bacterium]|jgi:L-histidine N-alpha-methyltransferase|nr:L-histidine N(alpha)-methyltransferase [Terriglobia bacterium]
MPASLVEADPLTQFADEVCAGLTKPGQKELPSKYLYDEVGSALFEVISVLPEYGLTRADQRILRQHAESIVARIPSPVVVAELGSGSGRKTRWILEALARRQPTLYHPIEISPSALAMCERELYRLDSVSILGFEAEYLDGLRRVASRRESGQRLLVLFLGSSIGNFDRQPGEEFLRGVRQTLAPGDALLLGADLEKPVSQMIRAYDDPIGVTAAFNLNLLARINRELDGDFALSQFRHVARYDTENRRIEMHLLATVNQAARIRKAGLTVRLREGETLWTESSHKYNREEVVQMGERAGFRCDGQWVDLEWPFAQSLFIA